MRRRCRCCCCCCSLSLACCQPTSRAACCCSLSLAGLPARCTPRMHSQPACVAPNPPLNTLTLGPLPSPAIFPTCSPSPPLLTFAPACHITLPCSPSPFGLLTARPKSHPRFPTPQAWTASTFCPHHRRSPSFLSSPAAARHGRAAGRSRALRRPRGLLYAVGGYDVTWEDAFLANGAPRGAYFAPACVRCAARGWRASVAGRGPALQPSSSCMWMPPCAKSLLSPCPLLTPSFPVLPHATPSCSRGVRPSRQRLAAARTHAAGASCALCVVSACVGMR